MLRLIFLFLRPIAKASFLSAKIVMEWLNWQQKLYHNMQLAKHVYIQKKKQRKFCRPTAVYLAQHNSIALLFVLQQYYLLVKTSLCCLPVFLEGCWTQDVQSGTGNLPGEDIEPKTTAQVKHTMVIYRDWLTSLLQNICARPKAETHCLQIISD